METNLILKLVVAGAIGGAMALGINRAVQEARTRDFVRSLERNDIIKGNGSNGQHKEEQL